VSGCFFSEHSVAYIIESQNVKIEYGRLTYSQKSFVRFEQNFVQIMSKMQNPTTMIVECQKFQEKDLHRKITHADATICCYVCLTSFSLSTDCHRLATLERQSKIYDITCNHNISLRLTITYLRTQWIHWWKIMNIGQHLVNLNLKARIYTSAPFSYSHRSYLQITHNHGSTRVVTVRSLCMM